MTKYVELLKSVSGACGVWRVACGVWRGACGCVACVCGVSSVPTAALKHSRSKCLLLLLRATRFPRFRGAARLIGWLSGRLVVWSGGRVVGWSSARLVVWSSGRLVARSSGRGTCGSYWL
jgi:hypothetical protein